MRVYFEVIFRDIPRCTVYTHDGLSTQESRARSKTQEQRGLRTGKFSCEPGCQEPLFYVEPRPNDVQRKTSVPCRTVPGAVVAWADDSRFSRRRVADANERRNREGTKAVTSVEQGALGGARERAR
jgi:hypothetical protein